MLFNLLLPHFTNLLNELIIAAAHRCCAEELRSAKQLELRLAHRKYSAEVSRDSHQLSSCVH